MLLSRPTARRVTPFALLAAIGATAPAWAQQPAGRAVSPLAPAATNRPVFDTQTSAPGPAKPTAAADDAVVAEVEGRAITLGQVGDVIRILPTPDSERPLEDVFPEILTRLIRQQAVVIRARAAAEEERPDVRRRMQAAADEVLADAYLRRTIGAGITETMLRDRYKDEYAARSGPTEVRVRMILADNETDALGLAAELAKGADFATLARRASKDISAATGGDLGYVRSDQIAPQLAGAAFAIAVGQVTAWPIKAAGGWFLLKVEDRRAGAPQPYAVVRDAIQRSFLNERGEKAIDAALDGLLVRSYGLAGRENVVEKKE